MNTDRNEFVPMNYQQRDIEQNEKQNGKANEEDNLMAKSGE